MSARGLMTNRCTIQRNSNEATETDPWGQDIPPGWYTLAEGVPCRAWFERVRTQSVQDEQKLVELTVRHIILPYDTDLDEDDRILNVVDRRGRELFDGPMRVDTVDRRQGHMIATLMDTR